MHNYFTLETEAEARRQEFQRAAAAEARASQATPARGWRPRFGGSNGVSAARSLPSMPSGALLELRRVPRPVAC